MPREQSKPLAQWRSDPVAFITAVLGNPETGKPFVLYDAQIAFLRRAFVHTDDGRLPFPDGTYPWQYRSLQRHPGRRRLICGHGRGSSLRL